MKEYLLILLQHHETTLGTLRDMPGLWVAKEEFLYVRGIDPGSMQDIRIKQLPVLHSYRVDEAQRLFPLDGVTPVGKIKLLNWQPIYEFITLELPVSAIPCRPGTKLPVRIIKSDTTREGCALMTKLATWKAYAASAPAIRLEQLEFAVAANEDVLIMGTPLPPVQGNELYKENNILLPAGFAFEVPLLSSIIQQKFNPANDFVLLFTASGEWHKIPSSLFVRASRSAVRLTCLTDHQ